MTGTLPCLECLRALWQHMCCWEKRPWPWLWLWIDFEYSRGLLRISWGIFSALLFSSASSPQKKKGPDKAEEISFLSTIKCSVSPPFHTTHSFCVELSMRKSITHLSTHTTFYEESITHLSKHTHLDTESLHLLDPVSCLLVSIRPSLLLLFPKMAWPLMHLFNLHLLILLCFCWCSTHSN